jgi:hypothetical protein
MVRRGSYLEIWIDWDNQRVVAMRDFLPVEILQKKKENARQISWHDVGGRGPIGELVYQLGGEDAFQALLKYDRYVSTPEGGINLMINTMLAVCSFGTLSEVQGIAYYWRLSAGIAATDNISKTSDGNSILSFALNNLGLSDEDAQGILNTAKFIIAARGSTVLFGNPQSITDFVRGFLATYNASKTAPNSSSGTSTNESENCEE